MIDDFIEHRDELETNEPTLTIFHLMEQHVRPALRFPKDRAKFTINDYLDRDLTNKQRQEVADYDNATLYNAEQVLRIIDLYRDQDAIIIYFADHGDEANDFRAHIGRSTDFPAKAPDVIHCQFDIPFMIYTTEAYRRNHPTIVQEIEAAKDKPYHTDIVSHLFFYLSGIDTEWYQAEKNILSDQYIGDERYVFNISSCQYFLYDELK